MMKKGRAGKTSETLCLSIMNHKESFGSLPRIAADFNGNILSALIFEVAASYGAEACIDK